MEYWMEDTGHETGRTVHRIQRNQGPGFISELDLEAIMGSVGDSCYAPPILDSRRPGGHQLPESPPDSGSENPYSPETQIPIPQNVLPGDYMLVHDHLTHEILPGEYIYDDQLKNDGVLSNVVVLQDPGVDLGHRGGLESMYHNRYGQHPELEQGIINPQLVSLQETLNPVYTSLQEPSTKKRKHEPESSQVKCEPAALSPESVSVPRPAPSVDGSEAGDDSPLQCIRFAPFQQSAWNPLFDCNLKPLQTVSYVVGADKGFNFSSADDAFVCQKKNHFQVTCQIQVAGDPHYVKFSESFKKVNNFCLHFYGVKAEDPSQEVKVEQSQSDRTKKPFHPVPVEIRREGAKITVGRLHFAETTNNNMRKKGRPNPDQRHFQLVVALKAHTAHADYMIAAHASDRIIVRASNPGQFESDCPEGWWQRGVSENSVHFNGRVGINTDRPDECCVVNGNLKVMGHVLQPSDERAKHNIEELDTAQQLKNVQKIRVVQFNYDPSFAEHSGLVGYDHLSRTPALDTGVIAQEVRCVLPEAVREAGDVALPNGDTIHKFLVVNKDRIFMENLGAVKELCKVTGHLESRIDQLEKINKKLCSIGLHRRDSSRSSVSNDSRYSAKSNSSKSLYSDNASIEQIREIARNIKKHECCHKLSHHSPKFTRKQCKNCHTNAKLGKYYNYNKTCVKYHSHKDEKKLDNPTYVDTESPSIKEEIKRNDTCVYMRDDYGNNDYSYGNTKLGFCCRRKDYSDASSDMISNKFLQIIITILIFIMAVCLIVMSVLYFREHQELITMKEIRMHEKFTNYPHYAKPNGVTGHRTPPDFNQIQNSKSLHAQHAIAKKTAKEKGPHKTTQEYITTTHTEPPHISSTLPNKKVSSNFVIETVQTSPQPILERPVKIARIADIIENGCNYALNNNNELDTECQSSCGGLDPPQTVESQESIGRSKSNKEYNDTSKPLEPLHKDKLPIQIPETLENNTSEITKTDNDSLKADHDLKINDASEDAYSNRLDGGKNLTDNGSRMKREVRNKRETQENIGSVEMVITDQSKETASTDCDTVRFGVGTKTKNVSLFSETVCPQTMYNFTYSVPLSNCLNHKEINITFKSSKVKDFHICDVHCTVDEPGKCYRSTEMCKPKRMGDTFIFQMPLDCNFDSIVKIRAVFPTDSLRSPRGLCFNMVEPFVEYNIRIYRHCHN